MFPATPISLSTELHHLMAAVDGAMRLTERSHEGELDAETGRAIIATLLLVRERLRLVDRAARHAIDPALLWCPENQAVPDDRDDPHETQGPILYPWSDRQRARRGRLEWKRARRKLKGAGR